MDATIGLCIIMKDESKVLKRMLESVLPIIDYYTVIDTGSSDDSKQIVTDFFLEKNISGEIYDHPFINYEDARNFAILKAKDKTDFCFTIDCDEILILDNDFDINNLKERLYQCDTGMIDVNYGSNLYGRRAFFRNSKPFYYFGAVHEILMCKESILQGNLKGLSIKVMPDGKSWEGSLEIKYFNHAKLILDYIDKNGEEPRHVFYLAQSYKDAGHIEDAILWYQKRVNITEGFVEERYWSQFMVAQLKWQLGDTVAEVADEFMKCGELDNLRAEHLFNLKLMYERNDRPNSAIKIGQLYSTYIGRNPYPQRVLFINPHVYNNPHEDIPLNKIEIDVCIVSYAKTDELKSITEEGIQTLLLSEDNIQFNIFVVESNKDVSYNNYPNTKTIYTELPFGYHRYLNLAVREGKSDYVVLCNSDLTYEKGWASEIIKAMVSDPSLLSTSPFCPQTQNLERFKGSNVHYGYIVREQLAGWCIFQKREIYKKIIELDERFDFWFCDDDYSMELKKNDIKHALVLSSVVNHHSERIGATISSVSTLEEKEILTNGQYGKFEQKWG